MGLEGDWDYYKKCMLPRILYGRSVSQFWTSSIGEPPDLHPLVAGGEVRYIIYLDKLKHRVSFRPVQRVRSYFLGTVLRVNKN